MNATFVTARLTVRESVRRWIVAACAAIAVCLVGLSAWGFDRLSHSHTITSGEVGVAVPQSLILFMFMFSFVVALRHWGSGFLPPNPVAVWAYLFCEGALLLTLALLLSTRLSAIASGVIGIALFGAAWLAGVVGALGTTFNISELRTVGQVSRYILPTDGLWHGAIYYLEPQSFVAQTLAETSDR